MKALLCVAAVALNVAGIETASAEAYPSRPVTMVVPYPAGGPSDTLARVLTESMRPFLGQPVVIENVSGAGGAIGTGRVARAAPDGYTLSLGHVQTHVISAATQTCHTTLSRISSRYRSSPIRHSGSSQEVPSRRTTWRN